MTMTVVIISTMSCTDEFLEVAPSRSLSTTELTTLSSLKKVLIATYSQLLGRNSFYTDSNNWFWGTIINNDANKGTDTGDQSQMNEIQYYAVQTNNASVLEKYRSLYKSVARANSVLALAALSETINTNNLTRISAEARFLRNHYYFALKIIFDNTPYINENWNEVTPVSNNQDLYPFIEADFQFTIANLPTTQNDTDHANKSATITYLGKIFLHQGKFSDTKNQFNQIVDTNVTTNNETYTLLPNYANTFRSTFDNSSESVFASQAATNTDNVNNANGTMVLNFPHSSTKPARPRNCCKFNQPNQELVNSYRTNGRLPLTKNT